MFFLSLNGQSFKVHINGLAFKKNPLINQSIFNFLVFFYVEFYIFFFKLPT